MSITELDEEIRKTKALLDENGYYKVVADHLAMLEGEREERLIEEDIYDHSPLGKDWRGNVS